MWFEAHRFCHCHRIPSIVIQRNLFSLTKHEIIGKLNVEYKSICDLKDTNFKLIALTRFKKYLGNL